MCISYVILWFVFWIWLVLCYLIINFFKDVVNFIKIKYLLLIGEFEIVGNENFCKKLLEFLVFSR